MSDDMGTFYTSCRVANHVDRQKTADVSSMLVDTGSEYTWIQQDILERIGIPQEKEETFVLANGQHLTRGIGYAILHVAGRVTTDEVVFGQPGDLQLLGARSLEGLNLRVDSRAKRLVAAGPILAASADQSAKRTKRD